MNYKLYTVFDVVNDEFSAPFMQKNREVMKRSLKQILLNSPSLPSEYKIYMLGEFDTESGLISLCGEQTFICNGNDIVPDPVGDQKDLFEEGK